ncbi:MAG: N-methyl-L-tryptophan oxidase [Pirellulales bacterium]|nr:N-methyl-L-tryptophan oxidase [Pirellulales bacterium]
MKPYDAIVLGVGGVGSAAALELARRGLRVLAIDRFGPAHDRGSSHGETRIIRQAYFEHPDYVPLAQASYHWWSELEACEGKGQPPLYVQTGLLQIGPVGGQVLQGVRRSAKLHGLSVENLQEDQIELRWPRCFVVPEGCEGVYERNSGYLRVEACVQTQIDAAQRLGVKFHFNEPVHDWRISNGGVQVTTSTGAYSARRLVIAAGAWASETLGKTKGLADADNLFTIALSVRRKPQYWLWPKDDRYTVSRDVPAVLFELPHGVFYSFPQIGKSVKVAEHSGGADVDDPTTLDRAIDKENLRRVQNFCQTHLPGVSIELQQQTVCMYTLTPDEHFIVDLHPQAPHVAFAAGLSGHGFKFVGILGRALADLVLEGRTDLPIGFLSSSREGLSPH